MWKTRRLPAPIFEAVHTSLRMPVPIPQPQPGAAAIGSKEFHYMTLKEAFQHGVFTDEYQPFKIVERTDRAAGQPPPSMKLVVAAADCGKPRCIFSKPLSKMASPTADGATPEDPKSAASKKYSMRQIVEKKMLEARVVAPTQNISRKLADVHDVQAVKAFLENYARHGKTRRRLRA
eukprot:jgi/Tetstr1/438424/TSEL_026982.t1